MSLAHAANAGRHALADRKDDLYETPPEAVRALLKVESLPATIWECACGPGSIVSALRAIVKLRKEDAGKRAEREAVLETYMHALGMLADLPLGRAALERAAG